MLNSGNVDASRDSLGPWGRPVGPSIACTTDGSFMETSFGPTTYTLSVVETGQRRHRRTYPDDVPVSIVQALDVVVLLPSEADGGHPEFCQPASERARVYRKRMEGRSSVDQCSDNQAR